MRVSTVASKPAVRWPGSRALTVRNSETTLLCRNKAMNQPTWLLLLFWASLLAACDVSSRQPQQEPTKSQNSPDTGKDPHSYSNPEEVKVRHIELELQVSFEKKTLEGSATLTVERASGSEHAPLVLDT